MLIPHGWIQSDAFRVVEFLIQQCHTCGSIFITYKDSIIHVVNKVEVSRKPVNCHLLYICKEQGVERNVGKTLRVLFVHVPHKSLSQDRDQKMVESKSRQSPYVSKSKTRQRPQP